MVTLLSPGSTSIALFLLQCSKQRSNQLRVIYSNSVFAMLLIKPVGFSKGLLAQPQVPY